MDAVTFPMSTRRPPGRKDLQAANRMGVVGGGGGVLLVVVRFTVIRNTRRYKQSELPDGHDLPQAWHERWCTHCLEAPAHGKKWITMNNNTWGTFDAEGDEHIYYAWLVVISWLAWHDWVQFERDSHVHASQLLHNLGLVEGAGGRLVWTHNDLTGALGHDEARLWVHTCKRATLHHHCSHPCSQGAPLVVLTSSTPLPVSSHASNNRP